MIVKMLLCQLAMVLCFYCSVCAPVAHERQGAYLQLKREYLSISLKPGPRMHVVADFHFFGYGLPGMKMDFPEDDRTQYKNFQAALITNGPIKFLPVTREQAPMNYFFDFKVSRYPARYRLKIPKRSKTFHLRISYDADLPYYFVHGSKGERPSGYVVHYILITGSTWKGTVDTLKVEVNPGPFTCKDLFSTDHSIPGICEKDGKWHHEVANQELSRDLELVLRINLRR